MNKIPVPAQRNHESHKLSTQGLKTCSADVLERNFESCSVDYLRL
jgi:hypothetical protein